MKMVMPKGDYYEVEIPDSVICDKNISDAEFRILVYLHRQWENDGCASFQDSAMVSKAFGIPVGHVERRFKRMVDKGIVNPNFRNPIEQALYYDRRRRHG